CRLVASELGFEFALPNVLDCVSPGCLGLCQHVLCRELPDIGFGEVLEERFLELEIPSQIDGWAGHQQVLLDRGQALLRIRLFDIRAGEVPRMPGVMECELTITDDLDAVLQGRPV